MSKRTKQFAVAAAVLLLIFTLSTTVMSVVMLINQQNVNKMIAVYTGQFEDPEQEDDVIIAQNYIIKSTTQISDAYQSGDTSQLSDRDRETLDMAKDVIKEIIKDNMTQFEKEEAVYQFLTKGMKATDSILTVISDTSNDNDNPHDVLKNRSAVCVGYATTFIFEAAVGQKYNYTLMSCKELKNTYAIPKAVMEALKEKKPTFSFSFKEKIKSEDEVEAKYIVDQLENYLTGTDKLYVTSKWTVNEKSEYVLCYYITYNNISETELSEKKRNKIDDMINDVLNKYKFYDTFGYNND